MLKSATLLSATPERHSQNRERRRSATPFYQKERCGSGTPFFDKERERSGTLFPLFFFDLYKLAHKAYAYEQVYIFIEKKGKFQCNLNNRFLTGNLSYQIQAFEESLMLNRFFFSFKKSDKKSALFFERAREECHSF